MAQETRRGKTYYYRKQRRGSQVISEYVGGGDLGACAARLDAAQRAARQAERRHDRQQLEQLAAEDQPFNQLDDALLELTKKVLRAKGFHQHKGQWRRKRMKQKQQSEAIAKPQPPALAQQAWTGHFRQALAVMEDLSAKAPPELIERMKNDLLEMRRQFILETDTAFEVALVDHVLLCWSRFNFLSLVFGIVTKPRSNCSPEMIEHYEKRLDNAQKRYLRACENLARVRKLLRPAQPQLNVGVVNALLSSAPLQIGLASS